MGGEQAELRRRQSFRPQLRIDAAGFDVLGVSRPFSELRRVLRRCENAAVTSVRSTPSRPMSKRGLLVGRRRTMADHTLGRG